MVSMQPVAAIQNTGCFKTRSAGYGILVEIMPNHFASPKRVFLRQAGLVQENWMARMLAAYWEGKPGVSSVNLLPHGDEIQRPG